MIRRVRHKGFFEPYQTFSAITGRTSAAPGTSVAKVVLDIVVLLWLRPQFVTNLYIEQ